MDLAGPPSQSHKSVSYCVKRHAFRLNALASTNQNSKTSGKTQNEPKTSDKNPKQQQAEVGSMNKVAHHQSCHRDCTRNLQDISARAEQEQHKQIKQDERKMPIEESPSKVSNCPAFESRHDKAAPSRHATCSNVIQTTTSIQARQIVSCFAPQKAFDREMSQTEISHNKNNSNNNNSNCRDLIRATWQRVFWSLLMSLMIKINGKPKVSNTKNRRLGRANSNLLIFVMLLTTPLINFQRRSLLARAQSYQPAWASPPLEQEIFLLNLEDGYFGCQVNKSQDFLQLFELSRLCDGTNECFLGSDELPSKLKCNSRERCTINQNSIQRQGSSAATTALAGPPEYVPCVNGVCLDGLCYCNDGFGGKSCDVPDENECKYRPCDVFAHCTNTMGSYYCSCFPGYDGDGMHCQDINECEIPSLAALCSDNSECCNLPGHFICKCKPGYQQAGSSQSLLSGAPSGNNSVSCTDIDECLDDRACGKGATCENLPGSYRCSCPPGFTGDPNVECIDMDECRNDPCGSGAQCTNIPGGYRCSCAPGFERNPVYPANLLGSHTFMDTTGALATPPGATDLQQTQTTNGNASSSPGALVACLDINECLNAGKPSPAGTPTPICGQNAQCHNTPGGYFCQCPTGFSGNPKVACQDIDECASHICGPNSQCKNSPGSFKCECKPGFVGNAYSSEGCQDDDECQRKDACGTNAHCFNSMGSYNCMCPVGFTGDPYTKCSDIDECLTLSPCGPGAKCLNTPGAFKCACPEKYTARGTPEMGCERAAVDVGCSTEFDCPQNAHCLNSTCNCKLGYQTKGVDCVDVDECLLSQPLQTIPLLGSQQAALAPPGGKLSSLKPFAKLGRSNQAFMSSQQQLIINNSLTAICGSEATCHNTDGSYRCECKRGYQKADPLSPISKCRDIDECSTEPDDLVGACGPNSKCFNTEGSFKCACSDGFIPVDPEDQTKGCKSPCEGVNCGQHATCRPHGEEAACVCKAGFTYDPNNIKLGCVDINECDTNYGPTGLCGARAICTNLPGSYKCSCPSGFTGDPTRFCEDINECDRRFGVFGQCGEMAICNNTVGSFTCTCGPGFMGDSKTKCSDIDECSPRFGPNGRCGLNALCTNQPGKFTCRCPTGYSGDPYSKCIPELAPCSSSSDCPNPNQVCQAGRCVCPFNPPTPGGADNAGITTLAPLIDLVNECQSPCERTECGPQATCRLDNELQPVCVCNSGYMAPGDGRSGCIDINECIQGMSALSGMTPLNALSAAAPLSTSLPAPIHNGSHPCGRNALCRNKPGTFDCVCPPSYSGNAYEACQPLEMAPPMNLQQSAGTAKDNSAGSQSQGAGGPPSQQQQQTNPKNAANYQQEPRTSSCAEPCPRGHVCVDGQCLKASGELLACRSDLDCRHDQACEYLQQPGSLLTSYTCVHVCELHQCGPNARCLGAQHKPICQCNSTLVSGDPYDRLIGCQPVPTPINSNSNHINNNDNNYYDTPTTPTTTTQSSKPSNMPIIDSSNNNNQLEQQQQPGAGQSMQPGTSDAGPATAFEFGSPTPTSVMTTPLLEFNIQQRQPNQTIMIPYDTVRPNSNSNNNTTPTTPPVMQSDVMTTPSLTQSMNQQFGLNQNSRNRPRPAQGSPPMTTTSSPPSPPNNPQQGDFGQKINKNQQPPPLVNSNSRFGMTAPTDQQFMSNQNQNNQINQNFMANYSRPLTSCSSDSHCPGNLVCMQPPEMLKSGNMMNLRGAMKYCGCPQGYKRDFDFCYIQRVPCNSNALCRAREECMLTSSTSGGDLSGICICPHGYKLVSTNNQNLMQNNMMQYVCMDRDECAEGNACAIGAICQNKIGSFECFCPTGTQGDAYSGRMCEPVLSGPHQDNEEPNQADNNSNNKQVAPQNQQAECQSSADCSIDRECDSYLGKCVSPCHVCGPRALCTASNHAAICLCPPRFSGNPLDQVFGCQEPAAPTPTTITTTTITTPIANNPNQQSQTTTTTTTNTMSSTGATSGQQPFNQQANPLLPTTQPAVNSNGNNARAPLDIQGVPVTTLLPQTNPTQLVQGSTMGPTTQATQTTTTAPPGYYGSSTLNPTNAPMSNSTDLSSSTENSVEFRTIPPSELFVMCLADGIQVELQLGGFDGIIYVKGHSQDPKCRKLVMSSSASEFVDFKVQFGHCDLIHRDGEASFVLVIQKHPKLVTYRARAYHVKCVYNTGERTVTLGFNVSMITTSGTIANTGPPPTCLMSITALDGREVQSAEIGQDLLLRVDVQPDSIYGGFARSCEAKTMDDDGEYQYEVTDANGCATDPSIFSDWKFDSNRKSLVARFNAFKFPSSNNLRFQCNIRVCFGSCPPVNCNGVDSYGRRRRRRRDVSAGSGYPNGNRTGRLLGSSNQPDDSDDSYGGSYSVGSNATDEQEQELVVTDAYKEGGLREEVMVQSNAILTFDKKAGPAAAYRSREQQQLKLVEDVEFVCLSRLGTLISLVLCALLGLIAFGVGLSCWCLKRKGRAAGSRRY